MVPCEASDRNSGRKARAPRAITAYRRTEVGKAKLVEPGPGVKQMGGTETGIDIVDHHGAGHAACRRELRGSDCWPERGHLMVVRDEREVGAGQHRGQHVVALQG